MPYVFGPIPSRRLGFSLGIDLIPAKICTYDCLYCQVGKTTKKTIAMEAYVPITGVLEEIERKLDESAPDVITFSGSGEPTLNTEIDQVIAHVKKLSGIKIAILTNGSLLWKKEVRERIAGVDIIMPTLSTAFAETFSAIHRPYPALDLAVIIDGIITLRREFRGSLNLEVVLLSGFNDSDREVEGLKSVINRISPDKIQLNTVVRPPVDSIAKALDKKKLENIKNFFGPQTEIIADVSFDSKNHQYNSLKSAIMEMTRRRPMRSSDVSKILNTGQDETEDLIKGLLIKGYLKKQEYSGEVFYSSKG